MKKSNWLVLRAGMFALQITSLVGAESQSLFGGRTLDGWDPRGQAVFSVENGVIVGVSGKGDHGWLCSKKTYGDFILELEVKDDSGNSGIQVRSHINDKDVMVGYQIEVDPSPRAWSGGLYEQGRRGWLQNLEKNEAARKAFKTGDWNKYRIACIGDSIKSWVNEIPAADYVDSMDLDGVIALQVHSGKNVRVNFRNLKIQDLGRRMWVPIWDGKSMAGWHPIGKGDWRIEGDAIHGTHDKNEKDFGHLVTDKVFNDFTVRLKYKAVTGNSGLYFHIEEKGFSGVSGFQAEIDPQKDAGGLYETNGRAWVSQPKPEDVKKWYKPNAWNTMTVSSRGRRIAVDVNRFRTAELLDDPGRLEGKLALQLHGGMEGDVWFKDIEILGDVR
ncbi:MAG TPA: DUF1080 domain-containing protein [Candidatus Eisenbacteria bacterium]|jgi:hypothetical protein|nr:DUF1080 domain-containing protein [Candidatus Eisenbacteria bacterium]